MVLYSRTSQKYKTAYCRSFSCLLKAFYCWIKYLYKVFNTTLLLMSCWVLLSPGVGNVPSISRTRRARDSYSNFPPIISVGSQKAPTEKCHLVLSQFKAEQKQGWALAWEWELSALPTDTMTGQHPDVASNSY